MNTLIEAIQNKQNVTLTENGAVTLKSTLKHTVDFFGLGGALRQRTEDDVLSLFSKAFSENPLVSVKTLFYLRDILFGQGERKTFRTCFNWLATTHPEIASKNLTNIVKYGRWDDLFCVRGTSVWKNYALPLIQAEWYKGGKPSLMFKWLKSNNTSSKESRIIAEEVRSFLGVSPRTYRKTLSEKRAELNVVERDMCANRWDQINYKGVPSKAALNYKDAFVRHDGERYNGFLADVKSGKTTINAGTLYPYDIVRKCLDGDNSPTLDVLWDELPIFLPEDSSNGIVVADVSGSMSGLPMAVSISLAMYISERNKGHFANHFITFSESPTLQKVIGYGVVDKVRNLSKADWGMNTDLESVFNLILNTAKENNIPASEMPSKIYIISDMEFDVACHYTDKSLFENISSLYEEAGYKRPELVFWNVNARNTQSPVKFDESGTCLVSGCSPSILKSLLAGEILDSEKLMMDTLNVERYDSVVV